MRSFFTGDRHAEEMLKPGDPLYDRIQRIRDHLREERGEPAAENKHGDWRDLLVSYQSADPQAWPRGGPYRYDLRGAYPGGFMDQSGSMPAPSVAYELEEEINRSWAEATPEAKAAARTAATAIIEGSFTFVGETDA